MKTQISNLRSGTKDQFLNASIDYSSLNKATSHTGHAGSTMKEASEVWEKVIAENPKKMTIKLLDQTFELEAHWSLSGKSVSYSCQVSKDFLNKLPIFQSEKKDPYLKIDGATLITVYNGQKDYCYICPSLITILEDKTEIDQKVDGYNNATISENHESWFVDLGLGLGEAEYYKSDWTLEEAIQDQIDLRLE